MRLDDEAYFDRLETGLDEAMAVASEARERGGDPTEDVEIPIAKDMADRVENILGIAGVAERVREMEADPDLSREEAALELAADFAEGTVGDDDSRAGKIEGAVRTAVALLTEGVVAAPIEGIDRVELLQNDDGAEFVNIYYAGPIRSAGGTAQALSVLVADYTRALIGVEEYEPRNDEVERYAEELSLYDDETGLQYTPTDEETRFIARNLPIMLDGEPTGDEEVSGFRDLERVDTNNARGGMCLVLGEGIAQKAPKIQRYTAQLDEVDWPWLQDLIDGTYTETESDTDGDGEAGANGGGDEADADDEAPDGDGTPTEPETGDGSDDVPPAEDGSPRPEPSGKYLRDLIAGRPVFGHPSETGGFRLRYGRARNHGFATAGVHPATMHLVDDFLATGTQIKTERPGKAAGVVPVDSMDGPTVKLANGDVRRIDEPAEALEIRNGVVEILDLGEYMVNYGEFVENNHPLVPASYTSEWWKADLAAAGADVQALEDAPRVDLEHPAADEVLEWVEAYDAPLHPAYTYLWHDLDVDRFETLARAAGEGHWAEADGATTTTDGRTTPEYTLVLERTEPVREALEVLIVEHSQGEETLTVPDALPFVRSLGLTADLERDWSDLSDAARGFDGGANAIRAVNEVAPFEVRERAPTRIGCRMGRPEKSEKRDLSPAVHTLFPIGEAGGSQRDVAAAAKHADSMQDTPGQLEVQVGRRRCTTCETGTYRARCPDCNGVTEPHYVCFDCDIDVEPDPAGRAVCPKCEREADAVQQTTIDVDEEYRTALDAVGERENAFEILKGVQGLSSEHKVPEPIEKGVLRAKNGVSSFKDGTVRYDMTDLPVTSVRAAELDVTVGQLRGLGYETDVHGDPLTHEDQLVELRVQDVVLSDGAAEHMIRTADFVDDLLTQYYGMDPFYEIEDRDDLVGELVFGMAPHTSAAVVGRVIGFTSAAVGYAHPYFHAAKRRNCFHPETKVWFRDEDGGWHHAPIETLVEERLDLDAVSEDAFGALVQELDGDVFVPSVDEDGETNLQRVTAVSRHPAPGHLVKVTTESGRTLRVTPEHSMRRWASDGVEQVDARDLSPGDGIPAPKEVPFDGEVPTFDLLAAFLDSNTVPNDELMIRDIGEATLKGLLDDAADADSYLKPIAELLNVSQSTVYNWVSRDSIPAGVLLQLYDRDALLERVPDDVTLGIRRDTASVSRQFEVDETVGTMLGYYAAEGFTRKEPGSYYQTTICTPDDEPREVIINGFDDVLNVEAFEENEWKITVSSRLIATLFADVIDAGSRAETKRVPDCVLSAPEPVLRAFLAAYFSGDGSTASDRVEIRAHTVSDDLRSDIVAALKRFGIASKVYREERTPETGAVAEFYDDERSFDTWVLKVTSENAVRFANRVGFHLDRKDETLAGTVERIDTRSQRLFGDGGDVWVDEVTSVEVVQSDVDQTYCLTVEGTNTLVANDLFTGQCDGDEDCVMLLMDGLLNFSKTFLPDQRGGKMDAPLVMSSRIDPAEIDDEAHNMDIVSSYPREFYEATREMADPDAVADLVRIGEDTLGTDDQYRGFEHTHDTTDIALGPDLSAYKTLGSMMEKMDAQLELSRKLRSVDETDVAERVIEYHFLPDLIGNLRAFSRQETRCLDCGEKYRRMPLTGDCRECGGNVNLTVHEGSVNKYMDTAIQVAEEYDCREYTKQRLLILERALESVFEDDTNKQSGIADFM